MILAAQAVKTMGINWESIGVIAAIVAIAVGFITWYISWKDNKQESRNDSIKEEISTSVNHLSDILLAKLETKEKVAQISERLARLEAAQKATSP